jgi:hypothetical protein
MTNMTNTMEEITNMTITNLERMSQISVSFNSPLPFLPLLVEVASVVFIGVVFEVAEVVFDVTSGASFEARYLRNLL